MAGIPKDQNGQLVQVLELGVASAISFGATSSQSAVFGAGTNIIRLVASQGAYIAIGENPTATTSSAFLPAGLVEYLRVTPGYRVAALRTSVDGVLSVVETL